MSSVSTSRKAPPPPLNRQPSRPSMKSRSSSKSRSKSQSQPQSQQPKSDHTRDPSSSQGNDGGDDDGDDDGPPTTSTLRSRTVTGSSIREFPSTPGSTGGMGGGGNGDWKLPGVKGTIGGISSPRMYPPSPTISSHTVSQQGNRDSGVSHPQNLFRIDPTMRSCLDALNLQSAPEIRRLFGL